MNRVEIVARVARVDEAIRRLRTVEQGLDPHAEWMRGAEALAAARAAIETAHVRSPWETLCRRFVLEGLDALAVDLRGVAP